MKKLLGILGTITIAGSGMAGLVGNAPAKNAINYQQTNNLENLKRNKREIQKNISFLKAISISADTNESLYKPVVYNENIIYFITSEKVIEYNLKNMVSRVVLESDKNLKFGVILYDKLYVFSYGGIIFEYNPKDDIPNLVYTINDNNDVNPRINYGVVLNQSIYFVTDMMGVSEDKIYRYNPVNHSIEVIFKGFNIKNLELDNYDGLSKIRFVHNNYYYKYYGKNNLIKTNILYEESNSSKSKEKISLYNSEYFFSDDNFTFFEKSSYNPNDLNEIYKYENFYSGYKPGNNWIFKLNGRIYFSSQDASKFNEYYSFESILVNEITFNNWIKDFKNWEKELENINVNSVSREEFLNKIQILLRYLREFDVNLEILKNKENIKELNSRISVVENNILNLKNDILNLKQQINNISDSLSSNQSLKTCATISGGVASSTKWIPEAGTIISGIASVITSICKVLS